MPATWAVLADIHGNSWALAAVLDDLERRGIEQCIHLGDVFFGPLDPAGTWRLLQRSRQTTLLTQAVNGNQDEALVQPVAGEPHPTHQFTVEQLPQDAVQWLGQLPNQLSLGRRILALHGHAHWPQEHLLEDISDEGRRLRSAAEVDQILEANLPSGEAAAPSPNLLLLGHSHVARLVQTPAGRLVVNPGSVGLPAYRGSSTYSMVSGSPHARYALLHDLGSDWAVDMIAVPYDHEAAARSAERNQRPDWAVALRTGFA